MRCGEMLLTSGHPPCKIHAQIGDPGAGKRSPSPTHSYRCLLLFYRSPHGSPNVLTRSETLRCTGPIIAPKFLAPSGGLNFEVSTRRLHALVLRVSA